MNGTGHRIAANATWLAIAGLIHIGPAEILCGAIVASSTAADDFSPDIDQRGILADLIPGGHRGPTHMPELVALGLGLFVWLTTTSGYPWFGWAVAAGWGSHLFMDMWWGRIPFLILGGRRFGTKLDTGGPAEHAVAWALGVACVPLIWWAVGHPGVTWATG